MVLRNKQTKEIQLLDTKYKAPLSPSTQDIQQVIAYADVLKCDEAVLIYTTSPGRPVDSRPGRTRVQTLTFDLGKDIDVAGWELIAHLTI